MVVKEEQEEKEEEEGQKIILPYCRVMVISAKFLLQHVDRNCGNYRYCLGPLNRGEGKDNSESEVISPTPSDVMIM